MHVKLTYSKPVEGITVRIAIDLKLFSILKEGEKSLSQLIEATKAESVLLSKLSTRSSLSFLY